MITKLIGNSLIQIFAEHVNEYAKCELQSDLQISSEYAREFLKLEQGAKKARV